MPAVEPRVLDIDPLTLSSAEHRQDPHPLYHRVRNEAPVWHVPAFDEFILTRFDDCEAVLRDPRFSSNPRHRRLELPFEQQDMRTRLSESGSNVLLFLDPPDHTRIRRLAAKAFTPRRVESLRPRIEEIVGSLLDEAEERGEFDVVGDLGYQLPVIVICELLGVPVDDRHLFHDWSSSATRLLDGALPPEVFERALVGAMSLINYLNGLIEDRRRSPGDDLLSALISAEEEGETLSEEELRSTTLLLFVAGHETTMNLIGNGTYALLDHPDELVRLGDDPSLVPNAVEEMLRWDGPVHLTGRIATDDLEVNGIHVEAGQQVVTLLAAANRDPERFEHPDRFDVTRHDVSHLTFSHGMHFCLGAALARLEGQVAFDALVRRFPRMERVTDEVRYRDHLVLRGLEELRVTVG